jgi:hypothetical protein
MVRWTCAIFTAVLLQGVSYSTVVRADDSDRPLIWSVTRSGQNGVAIRTGVQLQTDYSPKIGIDTAMIPTKAGTVDADTLPIKLWARFKLEGLDLGPNNPVTLNADANPNSGNTGVSLEANRSWRVSPELELASTSVLRASQVRGTGQELSATQRINLSIPDWTASLYTEAVVDSVDSQTTGSIGMKKSVFKKVNLSASFTNVFAGVEPNFHAGYQHRW